MPAYTQGTHSRFITESLKKPINTLPSQNIDNEKNDAGINLFAGADDPDAVKKSQNEN